MTLSEPLSEPHFVVQREDDELRLLGALDLGVAPALWRELRTAAAALRARESPRDLPVTIDLSSVSRVDGSAMALVAALRAELEASGMRVQLTGVHDAIRPIVELYLAHPAPRRGRKRRATSVVDQLGRALYAMVKESKTGIAFIGELASVTRLVLRRPRAGHFKEVPSLVERTGTDAIPIVLLLNFLLGFVMAYQSARQLKLYGANLYVADVVAISVTRELAPLMTAIIVCGRTGAAITAEIGTMKVSQEIDALRALGLRPFAWLVVPRVAALLLAGPALTMMGDTVGVAGGLVVATTSLGVTARGFLSETQSTLTAWDVEHGLIKSVAFALAIGIISCQQGFAASGGAEGVGRRTTATVVVSLFMLVVLDAVFTITFRAFGHP